MGLSVSRGSTPDRGTRMRNLCAPATRSLVTASSDDQSDPEQHSLLHPEPLPPMGSAYSKFGVNVPFDPEYSLVTSPVCTPFVLALARLLCGFYYLVYFIFKLSWDSIYFPQDLEESVLLLPPPIYLCLTSTSLRFFSYFTHLSAIGLCAYLWAAGVQTVAYALWNKYPLRRWPKFFQLLHLWLSATIITFRVFTRRTRPA